MRRNDCLFLSLSVALLLSSPAQAQAASITDLSTALHQLTNHINKTSTLSTDQINRQSEILRKHIDLIGQIRFCINL